MFKKLLIVSILVTLINYSLVFSFIQAATSFPHITSSNYPKIESQNIELVNHIGGVNFATFTSGNTLYVGIGPELAILNIVNPIQPTRTGFVILPNTVYDIDVKGNYVYTVNGPDGFQIVNITDPTHPIMVGFFDTPGDARGVSVLNGYAYVADGNAGLRVIDISNPSKPKEVAFFKTTDAVKDVVAVGQFAYIAAFEAGLRILNISNPLAPSEIGSLDIPGLAQGLKIYGTKVYIAADFMGLRIVNVSNPLSPNELGHVENIGYTHDLAISWPYAYVCDWYNGTLHIINIKDSNKPVLRNSFNANGGWRFINTVAIASHYAFVAADAQGLRVVDVGGAPIEVSTYRTTGLVHRIALAGNYLYAATDKLQVIDISNPESLVEVSSVGSLGSVRHIAANNGYVYTDNRDPYPSYLRIIDIADPAHPHHVGSFVIRGGMLDMDFSGNYAFLSTGYSETGMQVLNINNPQSPIEVSYWQTVNDGYGIKVKDNRAYLTNGGCIAILDVTDPAHPFQISFPNFYRNTRDVEVVGDYAYVTWALSATEGGGLTILDISNPALPQVLGSFSFSGTPTSVTVVDHFAYVADGSKGLRVLNVLNPSNPTEIAYFDTPGNAQDVLVSNDYIYVADEGSLFVFRLYPSSISGRVTDVNNLPVAGVAIDSGLGQQVSTDEQGLFEFSNLRANNYTIAPKLAGYAFSPSYKSITVPPSVSGLYFTILPEPIHTIITPGISTTLKYTDTQGLVTQILFPANAITITTAITLTPNLANGGNGFTFAGHAFDLEASQNGIKLPIMSFQVPVTVTMQYSDLDIRLVSDESSLAVWVWVDGAWQDVTELCTSAYARDLIDNVIIVPICRIGKFGLFGPTHQVFVPIIRRQP